MFCWLRGTKIDVSSRIKYYFSKNDRCFCGLLVEFNECYRLTSFDGITRVFNQLSSFIPKLTCCVGERHGNSRFFENKRLFLKGRYKLLWSTCRVQRMLSIETSFWGITLVFKSYHRSYPKYCFPWTGRHENRRFFENEILFLKERYMCL